MSTAVVEMPKRGTGSRGLAVALAGVGLALQALLLGFILLYVNVPAGYNSPYGLSLASVPLFRSLWPYPTLTLEPRDFTLAATVAILGLWLIYIGASAIVGRWHLAGDPRRVAFTIFGFAVLFNVTLALVMPPVLSSDIYHYGLFGRMVAFHGLNPYVTTGAAVTGDIFWPMTSFSVVTTRYGPLWTLIEAGVALIGDGSVLRTVLAFKVLAALFNLANCAMVLLLARRLTGGDGLRALLLYAWNPLILVETSGAGHNDVAMIAFALLGLLVAVRGPGLRTERRVLLGLALLVLSALIKYLTALLVLFFVVRCLVAEESRRRAALLALRMVVIGVALAGALYAPFAIGVDQPGQLLGAGAPSVNNMPNPLWLTLRRVATGLATSIGGVEQAQAAETYLVWVLNLGFLVLALSVAGAVARERADWARVATLWGVVSLVYIFVVFGATFPWYLVSPLAIAFVGGSTRLNNRLLACCVGLSIALMLLYTVMIRVQG